MKFFKPSPDNPLQVPLLNGGAFSWAKILSSSVLNLAGMKQFLLSTLLFASTQAFSQSVLFSPPIVYGTGLAAASGLAVQDVNSDGRPDIVLADDVLGTVSIRLNTGAGTFAATTTSYSSGTRRVDAMALGDVNADGNPDIAVLNKSSFTVGILLGTSTGAFQPVVNYTLLNTDIPNGIMLADVNSDGRADMLTLGLYNSIGVMLSLTTGGFAPSVQYSTLSRTQSVAVADMNADGKPDLILGGNSIWILLGDGAGQFTPSSTLYAVGNAAALDIQAGDINSDGKMDIVAINSGSTADPTSTANVLLGTSTGSLNAPLTYSVGYLAYASSAALADVNKDGRLDIVTNNSRGSVGVLAGQVSGGFPTTATQFSIGSNSFPWTVKVADVNGDTLPDLLTYDPGSGKVFVLLNTNVLATTPVVATTSASLYPNPAVHVTTLTGAAPSQLVQVYDALGRLVLTTQVNVAGTATLTLPSGLYVVRSGTKSTLRLAVE